MKPGEWSSILTGTAITVITAAVLGVFSKVYDMSEKQAVSLSEVAALRSQVAALDVIVTNERLMNARTRAVCEKWTRRFKAESESESEGD